MKSLRFTIITTAVALLSLGQPILLRTFTASTAAILFSASKAQAKDISEIANIAKAITVRIEGATQGSGVLINKKGNRYQRNDDRKRQQIPFYKTFDFDIIDDIK